VQCLFTHLAVVAPSGRSSPHNTNQLSRVSRCLQDTYVTGVRRKVRKQSYLGKQCLSHLGLGHWIQDCPTNDDREFDNRPRIKRTTGIPRSFLKAVDISADSAPQGIMVTPEGGFVVAQPDSYDIFSLLDFVCLDL
jgi:hypothetical protein